ncbi:MAG: zf-HC2 domain-containing protein [Solirubrobacteraceae bacterium]
MNKSLQRARFWRDHRWAPHHVSAYVDGELAGRARRRMEHHLNACDSCRRLLAGLRLTLNALHHLRAPAGPEPLRVAAAVRAQLDEPRRHE